MKGVLEIPFERSIFYEKYIHLLTKEEFEKEKQYNLTEEQFALLEVIDYAEAKRKAQSIARFMKKEIINNNGAISISFAKLCKNIMIG